jgi:hypothetical protein
MRALLWSFFTLLQGLLCLCPNAVVAQGTSDHPFSEPKHSRKIRTGSPLSLAKEVSGFRRSNG